MAGNDVTFYRVDVTFLFEDVELAEDLVRLSSSNVTFQAEDV